MCGKNANESLSWYVVRTHIKQEDRAESNLRACGAETFLPKFKKRRLNEFTKQFSEVIVPLFPRYIFARFGPKELLHKVRFTRGVEAVLSFGGPPTPIEDDIIDIICSRLDDKGLVRIGEDLYPGDKVLIKEGSLKNFTGIFERHMNDAERVMILLNAVSYQAHFEIERELVKKIS